MLSVADLEVNVLEFRQRSFQFQRIAEVGGASYGVFSRTETESESRFRPKLVHLTLVVPLAWVVYDEPTDALRIARDGAHAAPALIEAVVEVGAEPEEFPEQGLRWKRVRAPSGPLVYVPLELADRLLEPSTLAELSAVP